MHARKVTITMYLSGAVLLILLILIPLEVMLNEKLQIYEKNSILNI